MSSEDVLVYEARNRTRQAAIAVAGAVLFMVAAVLGLVGPHAAVNEATLSLIVQHQRATLSIVAAVVNAVAEILIAGALLYLWRCASARVTGGDRTAGRSLPLIPVIIVVGALIAVVAGVAYAIVIGSRAAEFATTGAQTYDEATRVTGGSLLLVLQVLGQLGALLIAISFVLVSLSSMRVGLLPRFLGYIGIVAGVLVLFPLIVVPIVQLYWLVAVAILFAGRWPSGMPEAWRAGIAVPWPPAAEMRARRQAEAVAAREQRAQRRRGRGGQAGDETPTTPDAAPAAAPASDVPASASDPAATATPNPRRKRKRRR